VEGGLKIHQFALLNFSRLGSCFRLRQGYGETSPKRSREGGQFRVRVQVRASGSARPALQRTW
jgi:hypothetical protein